jgi:hypothetical protein
MATSRMVIRSVSAPPADALRRTFETAIAQVQHSGKSARPSQSPIFVRKAVAVPDDAAVEKRALTEAARALAQLWNISPTLIR